MPASYTHYSFGQVVYNRLPKELQNIVFKNKELFNIGLNGPDILFYYKPLSKNSINRTGYGMHRESAYKFFENARIHIVKYKKSEDISYILGFICHFILDSNCHPFIAEAMVESSITHEEIEAELDGRIMRKNNLSPQKVNGGNHIIASKKASEVIAKFFNEISSEEIYKALKSVRFYNSILLCQNNFKRNFIKRCLAKIKGGDNFSHMIINVVPNPKCKAIVNKLMSLYENSIEEAVQMIAEYYNAALESAPINKRFDRNFE